MSSNNSSRVYKPVPAGRDEQTGDVRYGIGYSDPREGFRYETGELGFPTFASRQDAAALAEQLTKQHRTGGAN